MASTRREQARVVCAEVVVSPTDSGYSELHREVLNDGVSEPYVDIGRLIGHLVGLVEL
jgi:hypothetical protein